MQRSEKIVKQVLEQQGYDVVSTDPYRGDKGIPDFKVTNFEKKEMFYLEVKLPSRVFNVDQIKKIRELLRIGQTVKTAIVYPNKILINNLDENFNETQYKIFSIPKKMPLKKVFWHSCISCKYTWEGRKEKPVECTNCKSREWE